jgi:hypothetical protein
MQLVKIHRFNPGRRLTIPKQHRKCTLNWSEIAQEQGMLDAVLEKRNEPKGSAAASVGAIREEMLMKKDLEETFEGLIAVVVRLNTGLKSQCALTQSGRWTWGDERVCRGRGSKSAANHT